MADDKDTSVDDQALADEWAAALNESGDGGQSDIDALLQADTAARPAGTRLPMEEFGSSPKPSETHGMEGPNLDVILDIPVTISMEVGSTEINIRNLLQLNQNPNSPQKVSTSTTRAALMGHLSSNTTWTRLKRNRGVNQV